MCLEEFLKREAEMILLEFMTYFKRWILLGFPDPASEVEATRRPAHRPFSRCLQRRLQVWWALARPSTKGR